MAKPDPKYDLLAVLSQYAPGVVAQREILDAMWATYQANGFTPLTAAQVLAAINTAAPEIAAELAASLGSTNYTPPIVGGLPAYPTKLPRFPDSNEDPHDGWVEFGPQLQGAKA